MYKPLRVTPQTQQTTAHTMVSFPQTLQDWFQCTIVNQLSQPELRNLKENESLLRKPQKYKNKQRGNLRKEKAERSFEI